MRRDVTVGDKRDMQGINYNKHLGACQNNALQGMSGSALRHITHQPVTLWVEVATYNVVRVSLQRPQALPSDCIPELQCFVI